MNNWVLVLQCGLLFTVISPLVEAKATAINGCDHDQINNSINRLDQFGNEELVELSRCGLSIVPDLILALEDKDPEIVYGSAVVLGLIGPDTKDAIPALLKTLNDTQKGVRVRTAAANSLGAIQPGDHLTIATLLNILEHDDSADIRSATAFALAENGREDEKVIASLVAILGNQSDEDSVRANVAYALGDLAQSYTDTIRPLAQKTLTEIVKDSDEPNRVVIACIDAINELDLTDNITLSTLIRVLDRQNNLIHQSAVAALIDISNQLYNQSKTIHETIDREEKVKQIKVALNKLNMDDEPYIQEAKNGIENVLENFRIKRQSFLVRTLQRWTLGDRAIWIIHPLFWLFLIFAYPKSRQIQAIFFWNKYVRGIFGFWYVGFLLTWLPPLHCRLFAPFKDSLLADAKLDLFDLQTYFSNSKVKLKDSQKIRRISEAIPHIRGQIILESESGLGKTMLLRYLVKQTKRITVYLPAHKCENGVIEAIQAKLHGQAQDADFLRHLIYSGALDICIDGLNEVRAEVRANITAFVESYFKGNIVMTTQPLLWEPPATAKTYVLQPLQKPQIQQFLMVSQGYQLDDHSPETKDYAKDCTAFLEQALDENQPEEELAAARRILSNPMDLSVVAQLIRNELVPDLFKLQKQQYTLMDQDYEKSWNQKFPFKQFSEFVYQMRLNDTYGMTGGDFYQALSIMEKEQHRMVLSRQWQDANGEPQKEWSFRHDKITEFFLVQPFLGTSQEAQEKRYQHLGDPRFRGIYLLLARLLPLEEALALREELIHYAADTKDHTVSDDYVQILRSRQIN